ncbi:hypothetical protein [Oxalobacter paraformigenes]|uniref:Uncharacterized protein n=1 Tax=Oxalobacter paraformigenes TaxID=556268 RepID=C3X1M3_9BURK|nr:hypothetical protein [Oxalobacter paraformigenes]EEO27109.1 hypothetical protein OFAG_00262 [Oxalobacter paraformigenes]
MNHIRGSAYFRYAREIVFSHLEKCTAGRLIGLAESQGGLQSIRKGLPELIESDVEVFVQTVQAVFQDRILDIDFGYRMRPGVK